MRRFIIALAISIAIVGLLKMWKDHGHIDHAAPAPAEIQAESDQLALAIGLQPVPVYQIDIERTGEADCSDEKCDIHLGTRTIETPYWHEHPGAFRALLAHELAHIVQAKRGEQYESLLLPIVYALVLTGIISIGTGWRWWAFSGFWFAFFTLGPPWYSGFLRTWDEIFHWTAVCTFTLTGAVALSFWINGMIWKKPQAIRIAKKCTAVTIASLLATGAWGYTRTLETQPLKMERDADRMAACLVGPADTIAGLELIERNVAVGLGSNDDIFHSSPATRISTIKALNLKAQCQDVKGVK